VVGGTDCSEEISESIGLVAGGREEGGDERAGRGEKGG